MRLKDKVVIITGGAYGIGRAYALRFADEGAKVAIADIDLQQSATVVDDLKQRGIEGLAVETDVSSPEAAEEMVKKTVDVFGRIDILINNAAVLRRIKAAIVPFWELSLDEWNRTMAVNLTGTFLCSRAVFPYMKSQGGGKIINTGSGLVFSGGINRSHYIASKGGIVALTKALARELGEYNINVNCIAPGATLSYDPSDSEISENLRVHGSLRAIRKAECPEDIVGAAVFLASSDSDFITGQTVCVDGGRIMR